MAKSAHVKAILLLLLTLAERLCTAEELETENLHKLATANNELALKLYRSITQNSSENVFFSPFSISSAMGMLFYGTNGETAEELKEALGYNNANLENEQVHSLFHQFMTEMMPGDESNSYVLNSANAILVGQGIELTESYEQNVQRLYEAVVKGVDFGADSVIVEDINNWVKNKTNEKIEKLLDEIPNSAVLMLLNAVYFKGSWKTKFPVAFTSPLTFYNKGLETEAKDTPIMVVRDNFPYMSNPEFSAVELPYTGDNISMLILLPTARDGLRSLEDSLSLEKLSTIREQLSRTKTVVGLPKFEVKYERELSPDLQSIGARKIFGPEADFSGMTPSKVFVSEVLHKAVIEVNEEGSEAAAVTGIVATRKGNNDRILFANHPFIYAIVDKRIDMILFMGRIYSL